MRSRKIITVRLELTRRKAVLLLAAFCICWRPRLLGSEQFTMTTYYPAPYGGYASLLTTGQTLLARDGGNVGIGTASPGAKLDVAGQVKITGGSPGAGKVLTSDASGLATWQAGSVPPGAVMFFNLTTCPPGWTELVEARGRYFVGLPAGGTLAGTAGTALSNQENRLTGRHTHTIKRAGGNGYSCQGFKWVTDAYCGWTYDQNLSFTGSIDGTNAPYLQLLTCQKL